MQKFLSAADEQVNEPKRKTTDISFGLRAARKPGRRGAASKISRRSHYNWIQQPEYSSAFEDASEEATDWLAAEARRRAVDGTEEQVYYKGQPCFQTELDPVTGERRTTSTALTVRRYSDPLLMFLLKAARPAMYRENWRGPHPDARSAAKEIKVVFVSPDGREKP